MYSQTGLHCHVRKIKQISLCTALSPFLYFGGSCSSLSETNTISQKVGNQRWVPMTCWWCVIGLCRCTMVRVPGASLSTGTYMIMTVHAPNVTLLLKLWLSVTSLLTSSGIAFSWSGMVSLTSVTSCIMFSESSPTTSLYISNSIWTLWCFTCFQVNSQTWACICVRSSSVSASATPGCSTPTSTSTAQCTWSAALSGFPQSTTMSSHARHQTPLSLSYIPCIAFSHGSMWASYLRCGPSAMGRDTSSRRPVSLSDGSSPSLRLRLRRPRSAPEKSIRCEKDINELSSLV